MKNKDTELLEEAFSKIYLKESVPPEDLKLVSHSEEMVKARRYQLEYNNIETLYYVQILDNAGEVLHELLSDEAGESLKESCPIITRQARELASKV